MLLNKKQLLQALSAVLLQGMLQLVESIHQPIGIPGMGIIIVTPGQQKKLADFSVKI